jgi:FAD/FMN-containing dehydrogenase
MPETAIIDAFAGRLHGELLRPTEADYDAARRVYNDMIDRRPALIARCADQADVMQTVDFARDQGLPLAVRGGGHSGPGFGVADDAVVADLCRMTALEVDAEARTVRVQPGCTWGDVDAATGAHGLATVSGIISTTGVPGLSLGGGHGYLSRKYGLTADNLLQAEVVLADGKPVIASDEQHADLFWALRGGGGNFGVVTSFLFRLHPVGEVLAGPTFWSLDDADAVLRRYRDFLPSAPVDLYGFFAFMTVPEAEPFPLPVRGQRVCAVMWCWTGDPDGLDAALAPIRDGPELIFEHIGPMPYPVLQRMFDRFYPPGLRWHWKGDFLRELPDAAIARHLSHAREMPTPLSTMHLYPIDGAVQDVPADGTAFAYRDCLWSLMIAGVATAPSEDDAIRDWARGYWTDLHEFSAGGAYVNFLDEDGADRVRAAYRDNFDRLARVKARYDPDNLFRHNQNVPPAG